MIEVHNIVEELVDDRLDDHIARANICGCERCRADIKCYALNRLPARYVSREVGSLYARADSMRYQSTTDVVAAVVEAVSVIGRNPRHEG